MCRGPRRFGKQVGFLLIFYQKLTCSFIIIIIALDPYFQVSRTESKEGLQSSPSVQGTSSSIARACGRLRHPGTYWPSPKQKWKPTKGSAKTTVL